VKRHDVLAKKAKKAQKTMGQETPVARKTESVQTEWVQLKTTTAQGTKMVASRE
jgi:hypothetical protein